MTGTLLLYAAIVLLGVAIFFGLTRGSLLLGALWRATGDLADLVLGHRRSLGRAILVAAWFAFLVGGAAAFGLILLGAARSP